MFRIGLIGAGWIAKAHARAWAAVRDRATVIGVADINIDSAASLAAQFGARAYTDYRQLVDEGVDAVDICLPPHLHRQVVSDCAERRINIMCEKPIARDLAEVDAIERAITAGGVVYLPAHNSLFYPTVRQAARYLADGDLGPLTLLRSWECDQDFASRRFGLTTGPSPRPGEEWRSSRRLLGGGALIDGGFHAVYRLLYLAQQPVAAVNAMMGRFHPDLGRETEDTAILLVRFADGALGEVIVSYAFDPPTLGPDTLFAAIGRDGLLSGNEAELHLRLGSWTTASSQRLSDLRGNSAWAETFRLEVAHFLDVLEGLDRPIQTIADSRSALALIRAAYQSMETGRTTDV